MSHSQVYRRINNKSSFSPIHLQRSRNNTETRYEIYIKSYYQITETIKMTKITLNMVVENLGDIILPRWSSLVLVGPSWYSLRAPVIISVVTGKFRPKTLPVVH